MARARALRSTRGGLVSMKRGLVRAAISRASFTRSLMALLGTRARSPESDEPRQHAAGGSGLSSCDAFSRQRLTAARSLSASALISVPR
jgi:hypothetical protein